MPSLSTRESTPDRLVCSLITDCVCVTLYFLTEVLVCEKEINRSLGIMGRNCHITPLRTHRLLFVTLANALAAAVVHKGLFSGTKHLAKCKELLWLQHRPYWHLEAKTQSAFLLKSYNHPKGSVLIPSSSSTPASCHLCILDHFRTAVSMIQ